MSTKKQQKKMRPRNRPPTNKKTKVTQVVPSRRQTAIPDYGTQLGQVVNQGYGAALRHYPSTVQFAKVYMDPFLRVGARLPVFPVQPSTLIRLEQEFTVTCTSGGYGWALAQPMNCIANDKNAVWYTTGGSAPPAMAQSGTNVNALMFASPYSTSTFQQPSAGGQGRAARLVAAGFQVLNTSSQLSMAGKLYFCQTEPTLSNSMIGFDNSTFTKYPGYKETSAADRERHYYHRMLTQIQDTHYNSCDDGGGWIYIDNRTTSSEAIPYIGFYVNGAPNDTFVCKFVAHLEIIGQTINDPGLGVTTSDTKGLENVVSAGKAMRLASSTSKDHLSEAPPSLASRVVNTLLDWGEKVIPGGDLLAPLGRTIAHSFFGPK